MHIYIHTYKQTYNSQPLMLLVASPCRVRHHPLALRVHCTHPSAGQFLQVIARMARELVAGGKRKGGKTSKTSLVENPSPMISSPLHEAAKEERKKGNRSGFVRVWTLTYFKPLRFCRAGSGSGEVRSDEVDRQEVINDSINTRQELISWTKDLHSALSTQFNLLNLPFSFFIRKKENRLVHRPPRTILQFLTYNEVC